MLLPILAAPFIGSFCGVLITRVPQGQGVAWGRSACPACGHTLGPAEMVPIVSFCALRGRCRHCGAPIARVHLWVELAALGVAVWAALAGADGALLWASCALGWTLLTLGWIDAVCMLLPDMLTLPLIVAGLVEAFWLEPDALTDRAFGAAIGYTFLWGLALIYRRLRGREGLGLGDAKLLAAGGAWVGALLLPDVLLGAALAGLAWALRRGRPDPAERLPFGPFLAAGIWGAWLYL
jgi:leader peptidase (prepilin peptidase)/N-methyltransferase